MNIMIRKLTSLICLSVIFIPISCLIARPVAGYDNARKFIVFQQQDTTEDDEIQISDSLQRRVSTLVERKNVSDSVDVQVMQLNPYNSVAQYVKGYASGLYVQENSGEPGSLKNIVWRGLSSPVFSNKDLNAVQPTIYVNGIPLAQESNFAYNIQRYNFRKIGAETDLMTRIDMNAIKSIEVISDPLKLAELGPLAANGAIWIVTHSGRAGERQLSINSYYGFSQKPSITPINAEYENMFRQPFYALYGDDEAKLRYPGYLADSTNSNYYGASNWQDLYYKNAALYSVDVSLTGGSERANFSFYGGHKNNQGVADDTHFKTYNALFSVNMVPFEWFTVSAFVNANRSERKRNNSLRDQFAETAYLPDLSTPLSPNKAAYGQYLAQFDAALNDNVTNNIQGYLDFRFKIMEGLSYSSKLAIDYTEGLRDVFWPSTLMENSNFVSNYFGYTQRLNFSNNLHYTYDLDDRQSLDFHLGSEYIMDLYRFNYAKAYDGPNDFVKINVVNGKSNEDDYLLPQGGLKVYRWNNKDEFRMQSFYLKGAYTIQNLFTAELLGRLDGSSTVQRNGRWAFSPAVTLKWNAKNHLFSDNDALSGLQVRLGAARIMRPVSGARYATGPQYASNMGWSTEPGLVSYNGFAGISRPYNTGWIGYDIQWPYSDQLNLGVESSWFNERLFANVALYNKEDKNQITTIPVPSEYGYVGQHLNGMSVRNRGVEATIGGVLFNPEKNAFQWKTSINLTANSNELTGLPDGLNELVVGDRKLRVGSPIDQFWLYENQGIYNDITEIPEQDGRRLAFEGVYLNAGDPRWSDNNGDNNVDDNDKVMTGQATPKVSGGWNNQLSYKGFDLTFQFYFAAGHKLLNSRAATRYDFVNNESNNTIQSVREIFHWQQDIDISKYPVYNPWSNVVPYRVQQDIFLEDASFVKLRALSLGYDFSQLESVKNIAKTVRRAYLYISGTNLHTWTGFSGGDPELTEFNGYYTGYGLPLAPTYTLGLKLDL